MSDLFQDIVSKIKPYVMGWIGEVNTGAAIGSHELSGSLHTGSLSDAQAPQFLKTDGSRQLIGNLAVAEGITIDGVDISVFKSTYDTHASLDAATAHGSVGLHSHQNNPQGGLLDHGLALTGLLDDDHTQYSHADGSGTRSAYQAERLNKSITAGIALTGGGVMTADRTLDVNIGSGLGIEVGNKIAVDPAFNFNWTGTHTFNNDVTLKGQTSARHILPELTDSYDLGSSTLLWRKGWLSELDTVVFAQNTVTLLGGWLLISKDEGTIDADVGPADTQINFGKTMTVGDFVLFRAAGKVEYMQVGSLVSGTTYNVNRNLDGSGADAWPAGTPYAVLGQAGAGRIELNAYDTPRLQMMRQGATYNAQTELIRMGDLNGNWGYASEKWGLAIGEYASGKPNITVDQDGVLRFRLHTTEVMRFEGGNADLTGKLRMPGTSSAIAIGSTPPTASNAGTGIWIDRTGLYSLLSGTYQVKIDATDGKLYAGNGEIIIDNTGILIKGDSVGQTTAYLKLLNSSDIVLGDLKRSLIYPPGVEELALTAYRVNGTTYGRLSFGRFQSDSRGRTQLSGDDFFIRSLSESAGIDYIKDGSNNGNMAIYVPGSLSLSAPEILYLTSSNSVYIRRPTTNIKIPTNICPPWVSIGRGLYGTIVSFNPFYYGSIGGVIKDEGPVGFDLTGTDWQTKIFYVPDSILPYQIHHKVQNTTGSYYQRTALLPALTNWLAGVMWFYPEGSGGVERGLIRNGTTTDNLLAYINTLNRVVMEMVETTTNTRRQVITTNSVIYDTWNYVAFRIGVSGEFVVSLNGTNTSGTAPANNFRTAAGNFRLGWAFGNGLGGAIGFTYLSQIQTWDTLREIVTLSKPWHGYIH